MSQGKRGMTLEKMIDKSNEAYKQKGWALVDKVPTPWVVQYDKRTKRVRKAFPKQKSTVDYVGISHGRAIAFDAKSTNSRTSFPLANIEEHQKDYLINHQDQGGISFFIVDFAKLGEIYYLPIDDLVFWWENMAGGGRKSIPYLWFKTNCDLVKPNDGVLVNYLKHCETVK